MKFFSFLCLFVAYQTVWSQADDGRLKEVKALAAQESKEGWIKGGGVGLDFAQMMLFNPRVGAGANRIGLGGLMNWFANHKKGRLVWDNNISLQLGFQRIGDKEHPFEKNLDVINFDSRAGWQLNNDKISLGLGANVRTLLLTTYKGNLLSDENKGGKIAALFAPGLITVSPGVVYKPNGKLAFSYSPASMRLLVVANQEIANLGVHGTFLKDDLDPAKGYKKTDLQLGSNLRAEYKSKYFKDKLSVSSLLDLYSNYLRNAQNIDVIFRNEFALTLFKHVSLNLLVENLYDDDVKVWKEDLNGNNSADPDELGKRVSTTSALLIKYNYIF